MSRLRLSAAGLALLSTLAAVADPGLGPVFRSLGVVDGLPDSRVEALVQDRYGYLWIGTQGGLARYSGRRLELISQDPADPDALPGSNIMSLHAHSDGTVWAGVAGHGAVQIGPDLSLIRQLAPSSQGGELSQEDIWSLNEDCQGRVWMAFRQGGLARFDPVTGTLLEIPQSEAYGLAETGFQLHLHTDRQCRVWLVQSDRISRLPRSGDERFEALLDRDVSVDPIFLSLHEAGDGAMYISQARQLWRLAGDDTPERVLTSEGVITGFADDPDDQVLMSTSIGLLRWDPESGHQDLIRSHDAVPNGLVSSFLGGLLRDAEGGLWLKVMLHGLAYLPPGHEAFARFQRIPGSEGGLDLRIASALAKAEGDGGWLWVGSRQGGVQRLDLASGEAVWIQDHFQDPQLAELRRITLLAQIGDQLLLGEPTLLQRYDPGSGELVQLIAREQLDDGTFHFLRADGDQRVWLATHDRGLIHIDLPSGDFRRHAPDEEADLYWPERHVGDLTVDDEGRWWAAGRSSIYRQADNGRFEAAIDVPRGLVMTLRWVGDALWVATDLSLSRWHLGPDGPVQAHEIVFADQLAGGRVFGLHAGADGALWMILSNGMVRYRPDSGELRLFRERDGLAVAEFSRHSDLELPDGRLVVGSTNGLVVIDRGRVREPETPPPVHLTQIIAGGQPMTLAPGSRAVVELPHHAHAISFEFAVLSFVDPDRARIRLRLHGWDEDWLELVGPRQHHYSRLPPGRYRFEVQAAAADGSWHQPGDALELLIRVPPWRSWMALAAYAVLAVILIALAWRTVADQRSRRLAMRDARQKQAVAEEQRQLMERLNRSLEPARLARVIGEELVALAAARRGWLGYCDEQLPTLVKAVGVDAENLSHRAWRNRLTTADPPGQLRIDLTVDGALLASCLLEAGPAGFSDSLDERLPLLLETAGQALRNLLLIERNRVLAERAAQASAAKSEFLATMSHEIRTPLHGVLGMVELLGETEVQAPQQDLLRTLRSSGRQLQRIIDDVLDISRIEAGRLNLDPRPFELIGLLEQVVDLHAPNAARKGLDMRLRMASDLPMLAVGDADRIVQVLGNLLNNAVKFTDRGGVELVVDHDGAGRLFMAVCDSGPGIAPDDQARLFQPFVQLDASITRSHSGSGLGLAICRRLVAAMDGELRLARADRGCRFQLWLPVLPVDRPWQAPSVLPARLVLAAWLDGPSARVLHRLARRWGLRVVDARRRPPQACAALLIGNAAGLGAPPVEWLAAVERIVVLAHPYRPALLNAAAPAVETLRWPLIEARLLALVLGWSLGHRAD